MISLKQPLQTKTILNLTVTFRPAGAVTSSMMMIKYAQQYFPDLQYKDFDDNGNLAARVKYKNDVALYGYAELFSRIVKIEDTGSGVTYDQDYLFDNFLDIATDDIYQKLDLVMNPDKETDAPIAN